MNHRILITGSNGFIGTALAGELGARGAVVRGAVRSPGPLQGIEDVVTVGDIGARTDWRVALKDVDTVIHCAARAHVMNEIEADPLAAYRAVNVAGSRKLAEQATESGVRRLIYLSSIGVNGVQTVPGVSFLFSDVAAPKEHYAVSKWEGEQALWEVSAKTGLEVVVVRPPLVYGPGAKGNFLRLLQLVARGVPLPFGMVNNLRSLVGLDNLVDFLIRCVNHPAASGQTFLVSDGEDLSTPDLIRALTRAMGKPMRLLPVPVSWLRMAGRVTGKLAEVDRLLGWLQVDSSHTRQVLNWTPPISVEAGLRKTVDWFMEH